MLREEARLLRTLRERNVEPVHYVAGRKGIGWHRSRNIEMAQQWSGFSARPSVSDATEVTNGLLEAFDKEAGDGGVDEIYIVCTEFVSMLTQKPMVARLLPLGDRGEPRASPRAARCRCTSSSRPPSDVLDRCCRGTSRAGSSTPARVGRVGARRPPARHEGGDRQRERPDRSG